MEEIIVFFSGTALRGRINQKPDKAYSTQVFNSQFVKTYYKLKYKYIHINIHMKYKTANIHHFTSQKKHNQPINITSSNTMKPKIGQYKYKSK